MGKYNSDTFCYLPFGSVYVDPTGELSPCCIAATFKEGIRWEDFNTLEDLVNSAPYKRIRKQLLNGIAPSECNACFIHKNLHREGSNREFEKYISEDTLYNDDYSVNKITYVDLRLSNLCNFACRMCFHGLSSTWYDYWGYIQNKPEYKDEHPKFLVADKQGIAKFSDTNINTITKIYLAGGEPFITSHTFELIGRFSDEQASKVDLLINTNLSTLKYKGEDILEKLKRFKSVQIACSCDGYGEVGKYQRPGFNSERFFSNLKTLVEYQKKYPHFYVEIDYTISTINVYHTFDFIEHVQQYLSKDRIRVHAVVEPIYFSTGFFPASRKRDIIELYNTYSKKTYNEKNTNLSASLDIYTKYLEDSFNTANQLDYLRIKESMTITIAETIRRFDEVHKTDYKNICPWLEDFMNNIII